MGTYRLQPSISVHASDTWLLQILECINQLLTEMQIFYWFRSVICF